MATATFRYGAVMQRVGNMKIIPQRLLRHGSAGRCTPIQAEQANDLAVRWNCKAVNVVLLGRD